MFGNRTKGAGDDLYVNATLIQLRKKRFQFSISNQRIAADEREVERSIFIDETQNPFYQLIALVVSQFPQCETAVAKMCVIEGIAARAAERALPCDFDGQRRTSACNDSSPCVQYF